MQMIQRDFIVEANDRLLIESDEALESIVARLPVTPTLKVADIAAALDVSETTVHRWIRTNEIATFNMGTGNERAHQRPFRNDFIKFLKSRVERY